MKEFSKYYVRLFMFLMPILFLPVSIDAFGMGKNVLIMMLTLGALVVWLLDVLINKKESLQVSWGWWLMLIVVGWAWIGWYRMMPGVRMKSVVDITGVGMLTTGLVWFFLWLQTTSVEERRKQLNWLTGAGVLVAITSVIIFLIPNAKLPINWPKSNPLVSINANWSLMGSIVAETWLLLFLILGWGKRLMVKLRDGDYILEAVVTSFLSLVLALDIFKIFKSGWFNLDGATAWAVAVETFKRSPIWGVGAGNFAEAFNKFRPESYNLTANWANGFLHSSNGILNLWTELGVVGMIVGIIAIMGMRKGGHIGPPVLGNLPILVVMVLAGLFLPVSLVGMMMIIWVVVGVAETKKINLVVKIGENGFNVAPWVLVLVLGGGAIFSGYWLTKIVMADVYMRQSLVAAAKNDGGSTYNLQIKAIGLNPNMGDYRRAYSQTNLALASTLLTDKNITEENKQKASTLVQQAVREGKAAIALDGNNPSYWTNLASIYRQLVGVVDGAADWSYQAYQQAVVLEPANPISKLDLGGLLFAANKFDEADRIFEQVVTAKPDFANGWYNWAYSAKKLNKLEFAVARLTQAIALVPTTSGDYEKASGELETWKKELAASTEATAPKAETLKTAEPLPTGGKNDQVIVPTGEELAPVVPTAVPTI